MNETFENQEPTSIDSRVMAMENTLNDLYTKLERESIGTVEGLVDEALHDEVDEVKAKIDDFARMINSLPFDNPAEKDKFVSQIGEMFAKFSKDTETQITDPIDEGERVLLQQLIGEINDVMQIADTLFDSSESIPKGIEKQTIEISISKQDAGKNLGDILKGSDLAIVKVPFYLQSAMSSQLNLLRSMYGDELAYGITTEGAALKKAADGNMYIANIKTGEPMTGLPVFPTLYGMQVIAKTYKLPKEPREMIFDCEIGSAEEKLKRIDTLIDDPTVNEAIITYSERAIGLYKKKYPDFPFKVGEEVRLVRGDDGRFCFADDIGKPDKGLPHAFIFSGDRLNYETDMDTIDRGEGELITNHMDEYLNNAFEITAMADAFQSKYGIELKYSQADLNGFANSFVSKRGNIKSLDIRPKSKAEIVAAIDEFTKVMDDYGPDFAKGDIKRIYIVGLLEKHGNDKVVNAWDGLYVEDGSVLISDLASADHEFFHASERARAKHSKVDGGKWFTSVDDMKNQGDESSYTESDIESANVEYNNGKIPTQDELEIFYKSGATSFYSYREGFKKNDNEIQAEIWEFVRTKDTAAEILGKKNEAGEYEYPQLRENVARVLKFALEKSKGKMNRDYWTAHNKTFDDDLWAKVETKVAT